MTQTRGRAGMGRQWTPRIGLMVLVAGGLTACGGQQASQPATSLPAPTVSVQATVASSPAATSAAGATPLAATSAERLAAGCADYNAWRNNPDVKAALDKMSLWPAVIAEGEKAAAGEQIDGAAMKQDFEQMEKLGKQLRTTNLTEGDHEPLQLAGRAMGLTSRLAGGLSTGTLDAKAAGEAVSAAKTAIAAYQEDATARQAACGG